MSNGNKPSFLTRVRPAIPDFSFKETIKPSGIWRLLPFDPFVLRKYRDWTDADIIKMISDRIANFATPRDYQRGLLYAMGDIASTIPDVEKHYRHNDIMQGYIDKLLEMGLAETASDIGIRRVGIGTGYAANANQTDLAKERLRYAFSSTFTEQSDRNVFVTMLERDQGAMAEQEVIADAGNSLSQLKITDASVFDSGDRVRVQHSGGYSWTEVDTVDTVDDILTFTTDLRFVPVAGDIIIQPWSEIGLFCGSTATDTLGSGLLVNRIARQDFDKGTKMVAIEGQTILSKVIRS